MFKRFLCFTFSLTINFLFSQGKPAAQLISIKTVPVASGDQFMVFPSKLSGAGNLSLAVEDKWADPFINPAKGYNLERSYFFCSPAIYHITGNNGSARTLPLGGLFKSKQWFGSTILSVQQLEPSDRSLSRIELTPDSKKLGDSFSENLYLYGSAGRYLPGWKTAIATSFFYANLDALQGVDLLYPGSLNIEQFGFLYNFRLGVFHKSSNEQEIEAVLLYDRSNMTHNVFYQDADWNTIIDFGGVTNRIEKNLDRSSTWGVHLGYVRPLPESQWKFGSIFTFNLKSHPKIPNYELMNIPRDPGNSWAYHLGIGFAKVDRDTIAGFEIIYEPIWSHTWADAAENVTTRKGGTILRGEKTVENDFSFSNWIFRFGLSKAAYPFGFQLGTQIHSIGYLLYQYNYLEEFRRSQREHWLEWTITWGLMIDFQSFEIRYNGSLLIGTGLPGVNRFRTDNAANLRMTDQNILLAPSGELTLDDSAVFTHRFTVAVPLR